MFEAPRAATIVKQDAPPSSNKYGYVALRAHHPPPPRAPPRTPLRLGLRNGRPLRVRVVDESRSSRSTSPSPSRSTSTPRSRLRS